MWSSSCPSLNTIRCTKLFLYIRDMSFNNISYDNCTYVRHLKENVGVLSYVLSPYRFEHQNKCRHELGLLGGTAVSHVQGNLVDLESELRGQTRYLTWCDKSKAVPLEFDPVIRNDKTPAIDTSKKHLPACQMISYRSVPLPPPMTDGKCR
jgi:hypothetical protein